jgi:uncharacterized protein GlcG (DUF336 family)
MRTKLSLIGIATIATSMLTFASLILGASAFARDMACSGLPSREELKKALTRARAESNGGLNLDMWGTMVGRDGTVCAVVFTGRDYGDQWPGSRVISAQKANTANAFSLPKLALSTANLYSAVQPGGPLYGLQHSNPVDPAVAYKGSSAAYGTEKDPMVSAKIGGVNVFGGGLALYNAQGRLLGGLGVSGDTSCADHNIAWKTRHYLSLDHVPGGVSSTKDDNIIYDIQGGRSVSGFGHPDCGGKERAIGEGLPKTHPISGRPQGTESPLQ